MSDHDGIASRQANGTNYEHTVPYPTGGQGPKSNGMISPPDPKRHIRELQIRQLDHGYMVVVGCQTFAIESKVTLLTRLIDYINDPGAAEEKWAEGKLF